MLGAVERPALRLPGQPLGIAVTHAVDRRSGPRVVFGDGAAGRNPQDFAAQIILVLRQLRIIAVTCGDVQVPVRANLDPPAVVVGVARDMIQQNPADLC